MTLRCAWLCAVIATVTFARDDPGQTSFHTVLKVNGPVAMEVTTGAGHIHLRAGEPGRVLVTGAIRAYNGAGDDAFDKVAWLQLNPPIEQVGNTIRIGSLDSAEWADNISISYELIVPPKTSLRTRTGVGEQSVDGIRGPVDVLSSSGKLVLSNIGSEVQARTGVGDILMTSVHGDVQAVTSSGSIRGAGVGGTILARTGVGHVKLDQSAAGNLEVVTSSGNVEVTGAGGSVRVRTGVGHIAITGEPAGRWSLATTSGNLTVRVPSRTGFDVRARTVAGRVSASRPIAIQGSMHGKELRGAVGGGGPLLDMRTGVGNIRIE